LFIVQGVNTTSRFNILPFVVQGGGGGKDHGSVNSLHKRRSNANLRKIMFHDYQGARTNKHNLVVPSWTSKLDDSNYCHKATKIGNYCGWIAWGGSLAKTRQWMGPILD